jgi:hypothetical protein
MSAARERDTKQPNHGQIDLLQLTMFRILDELQAVRRSLEQPAKGRQIFNDAPDLHVSSHRTSGLVGPVSPLVVLGGVTFGVIIGGVIILVVRGLLLANGLRV